jgi:hypothetical protein
MFYFNLYYNSEIQNHTHNSIDQNDIRTNRLTRTGLTSEEPCDQGQVLVVLNFSSGLYQICTKYQN